MFSTRKSRVLLFLMFLLALFYSSVFASNQDYWINKLSAEEKEIFENINKERSVKKVSPLLLNWELSDAIKEELNKFVEAEQDSPNVLEKINELFSNFDRKYFLLTDTTNQGILTRLKQSSALREQMLNSNNLSLTIATIKTKQNIACTWLYFSNYFIDCVMEDEMRISDGNEKGYLVSREMKGKSNARYMKILYYEGTRLPFLEQPKKSIEEDMKLIVDSSFVVSLPIDKFGKEPWRIAVFVRNNPKEPYELVKYFKRGE